ncbi:unnamed protein product [Closterium sp. Naga37s-1]|nr:unnamed protein product [Closterium sp. Naga37s-1]
MGNSRYHRRFEVLVPLVTLWLVICALPSARSDDDDDEGGNAVTGACEVSSLAGYKYAVDLSGNGLYLHWAPKGTTEMDFAIEARPGSGAESTWVSVGWSSGRMAPADAVMGNLAGNKVAAYSIQGYDMGSVAPTTGFSLASTAVVTSNGGSTVSKFTRTIGDGDFPVAPDANTLIWAFSGSGSQGLDYHGGNFGIVNIDFTCASGAAPATGAPDSISGGSGGSSSGSSSGGGGGGGASCPASSLAGFDYQAELTPGLLLHWKQASATALDMALEATASGGAAGSWVSVAWTGDGRMVPSDAVIGNMPGGAAGAYAISGYDVSSVAKTTTFSVGAAATETASGGSSVVKFTRTEGEGSIPMSLSAPNALIWAYSGSGSQSLDYHGSNFGSKTVSFNCGGSSTPTTPTTPSTPPTTATPSPAVPAPSPPATTPAPPTTSPSAPGASGSNSSGPACTPSALDGYTCSEKLSGNDFVLHWKTNADSIDMACEVATAGWVSIGWSADGSMYPSDAIIGNLASSTTKRAASTSSSATGGGATVAAYSIAGYGESDVAPAAASALPLTATAVETSSNGKTVIKFSRVLKGGKFPIDTSVATNLIWAFSADGSKKLANHGINRGSALDGSKYVLHWNATGDNIAFACEVATAGWVSLGWSADGKMYPSEAVIGNLPSSTTTAATTSGSAAGGATVATYSIAGYSETDVTPVAASGIALAATAVDSSANGKTVVKFTRAMAKGKFPISATGPTKVIWAYSADDSQALANHDLNRGSATINFVSGATDSGSGSGSGSGSTSGTGSTGAVGAGQDSSKASNSTASSSGGGGSSCTPSTIAGYTCSAQLSGDKYILHWKANTSTISFAAEVSTSGWVSLGWNSNGKMQPADAAIGNQPAGSNSAAVAPYSITGYGASDISATSAFALSTTVVESSANGKTVVKFTRPMAGGSYPINTNGPTTVIWAYSADGSQTLANHGPNCGSAQIDFISGSAVSTSSSSSSTAFIIHGWLLGIAFGILMPAAILISRIFLADKLQEKPPGVDPIQWEAQVARAKSWKPMAFETHKWMQIVAVVLAVAGCIIGMVESGSVGLQGTHGQLGIAIFVMIFIQPVIGHFRPNKGTVNRPTWFIIHWVFGMVIVGLAWVNTFLGFDAMASKFASDMQVYFIIFAIAIGLFAAIYVVIFVVDQVAFIIARMRPTADEGQEKLSFHV